MTEYISTFITGFGEEVRRALEEGPLHAQVLRLYDGLVHYRYEGDWHRLTHTLYLNNTFSLLQFFPEAPSTFEKMVAATCQRRHRFLLDTGSYRVRFSRANQFAKVERSFSLQAERHVAGCSRLRLDRVNPQTEVWYILRSEGVGFYGQLLHKREATEKNLQAGELRPEFAYLLCSCARFTPQMRVCDPFCGYGAIPRQLLESFHLREVLAFDNDPQKIERLKKSMLAKKHRGLLLKTADALALSGTADGSLDAVITDPPWGYYEQITDIAGFYRQMLRELDRVLGPQGQLILLSARKAEYMQALESSAFQCTRRIDTLVNGKKAGVFCCEKRKTADEAEERENVR